MKTLNLNDPRIKSKKKYLEEKLDDLVSKIIIKRYGATCVVCGKQNEPTNGHLFSRGNHILRWDIRQDGNCHCQCRGCNLRHEHDPYPYQAWYRKKFGNDRFDLLYTEWNKESHFKLNDLIKLYEELAQQAVV